MDIATNNRKERYNLQRVYREEIVFETIHLYIHRTSQKSLATNFRIATCCSIFNLFCNSINMNCVQYMCKHALHLRNSIIIDIFLNSYFAIVRMFVKRIKKKNYLLRERNRSKNSMEKNYLSNKFIRLLIRLINSSNIFIFDQSGKISNNFERIIHLETRRES